MVSALRGKRGVPVEGQHSPVSESPQLGDGAPQGGGLAPQRSDARLLSTQPGGARLQRRRLRCGWPRAARSSRWHFALCCGTETDASAGTAGPRHTLQINWIFPESTDVARLQHEAGIVCAKLFFSLPLSSRNVFTGNNNNSKIIAAE